MSDEPDRATHQDWLEWHRRYDDPSSGLPWRLKVVRQAIGLTFDRRPAGPIKVVSICAGQAHDLIGSVAVHARRNDVTARLVELDPRNVRAGSTAATQAGLRSFEFVTGDAALTDVYAGAVPADLVLVCGVFGNITDTDILNTITVLPSMATAGGRVIWTRHHRAPDRTPQIRTWFTEVGFDEVAFHRNPDGHQSVGVHELSQPGAPLRSGMRLFDFLGYNVLR